MNVVAAVIRRQKTIVIRDAIENLKSKKKYSNFVFLVIRSGQDKSKLSLSTPTNSLE